MKNELTFSELRTANVARCAEVFHPLTAWTPTDWACAMAGEAGEVCNVVKKLRRHVDGTNTAKDGTRQELLRDLEEELADVVIYLDLLAARLNLNLAEAVRNKFNAVSELRGSVARL